MLLLYYNVFIAINNDFFIFMMMMLYSKNVFVSRNINDSQDSNMIKGEINVCMFELDFSDLEKCVLKWNSAKLS